MLKTLIGFKDGRSYKTGKKEQKKELVDEINMGI